jgi:hypothetical protein
MTTERLVERLPSLDEIERDLARNSRERSILKSLRESLRRAKTTEELGRLCRASVLARQEVDHAS